MLKTKIMTIHATFAGIDAGDPPRLAFYKLPHHRPNGKGRYASMSVAIRDAGLLVRAERELHRGDEIEVTIETRWAEADLPTTLLDFSKVPAPHDQPSEDDKPILVTGNWPIPGYSETVYVDSSSGKPSSVHAGKGKSK